MPNAPLKTNASDSERRKYVLIIKKPTKKLILVGSVILYWLYVDCES